jgi:hypothetical protein
MIRVIWNRPSVIEGRISALRPETVSSPVVHHPIAAAERGQPAQRHREQIDQENADQEGRQRDADQRYRLKDFRERRVALQRRVDPHQDAEHHRQDGGADGELQRRRHPLLQQVRDRLAELVGDAEFELGRVGEISRELHRHGIVEAERLADLGALRR